jgi:hypothetical protein
MQQTKKSKRNSKREKLLIPPQRFTPYSSFTESTVPTEMDVKLILLDVGTVSGAATTVAKRYNSNCAFQPIVSGPTAAVPGFSKWAAFYGFYRVIAYDYEITMTNNEAFSINCFILNTNNDPGISGSATASTNALSQHRVIAAKGGMDKAVFKKRYRIAHVAGTNAVETDDTYRALVTGSPTDLFWLTLGAESGTGANITLGSNYVTYLTMYVRFYDRLIV